MSRWLRRCLCSALAAVWLMLMSTGCVFQPVDELYALPALPQDYSDLQAGIDGAMRDLGAEYAVINYGSNTSTIQLLDLDGNGDQEIAAVFLRVQSPNGEEKPLRIILFRRSADNTYNRAYELAGDGTSIHSVVYEDITGDGNREVIVSWQMGAGVYVLSAYQLGTNGSAELMSAAYNEGYLVTDLDRDEQRDQEILVFQRDTTGESTSRAELYDYQEQTVVQVGSAPLSLGMLDLLSTKVSPLSDGTIGVYAAVALEEGAATDVLTLQDGSLVNVTRDQETGVSLVTQRTATDVMDADINGDGVVEVPIPELVPSLDPETPPSQSLLRWYQFNNKGKAKEVCVTYHSVVNGWFLTLPDSWDGLVTVARDDTLSARGERAVVFYYVPKRGDQTPQPFLTIYRLTGSNRNARSRLTGRFTLASDGSTIYSALLNTEVWNCGLDQTTLGQQFRLITADWST